jgi:hypothetical protein
MNQGVQMLERKRRVGILLCMVLLGGIAYAQSGSDPGTFGVGVKASLLGGGIEAAARVSHRTNVRAGFNILSYGRSFTKDGIPYSGQLSFKTVEAHYDVFPFAGKFHVSPGVLVYAQTPITATAAIPAQTSFSLGASTYYSSTAQPVTGTGNIKFNHAAPMATFGWGNLVPRKKSQHFSIPAEFGVAFQGTPKATLNLNGSACLAPDVNCMSVTSPQIQSGVLAEQTKINNAMSFFKAYPIISVGLGYKF